MPPVKEGRIEAALAGLVWSLLPDGADGGGGGGGGEGGEEEEERRRLVQALKPRLLPPQQQGTETAHGGAFRKDSNDILQDVREHILHSGRGPGAATRFANVYSRLMTLPIINNKAAILHLLHCLSVDDEADEDEGEDEDDADELQHQQQQQQQQQRYEDDGHALRRTKQQQQQQQRRDAPPPSDRPRTGLTEASSSRHNRGPAESSAPKTPRDEYVRSAAVSRQDGRNMSTPYPESAGALVVDNAHAEDAPADKSPTEMNLLRDLPFVLQGLSTSSLIFADGDTLDLPSELPLPVVSILHTLAEPSLLYRSLQAFVKKDHKGLVVQALQSHVEHQLRAYLGLISTMEGEIRRCLSPENTGTPASPDGGAGPERPGGISMSKVGVTLKRCVVWTRDATLALRLLSSLTEQAGNDKLKGGALISLVHRYATANGDPFVSSFTEKMLGNLTKPFYNMLRSWIYEGELKDPYGEFFVCEVDPEDDELRRMDAKKLAATSVWDNKYRMKPELVPTNVDGEFAAKVFLIGKSLNFIRYSCGDSGWVEQYSKEHSRDLHHGDIARMKSSVDDAYKATMAHLIHLLDAKFGIFAHLEALKRYLLLGQGDFVALLIESLAGNLDKPAGTQYRHTLTSQLDHAIRGSNAQFDGPEILRRLDARLLELMHSEIGWDVFTLEYKVDAPCDVVVTTWASKQYLAVFNLLWRIKRIEFVLGNTWRRVTNGARTTIKNVVRSPELASDWQAARCMLSAMVHFIHQLQYYVMVEVIEASWNKLQGEIRRDGVTLDGMVEAHTEYLRNITHRATLGGAKNTLTGNKDDALPSQLRALLKAILSYTNTVDGLLKYSIGEESKAVQAAVKKEGAGKAGGKTAAGEDEDVDSPLPGDYKPIPGGWGADEIDSPLLPVPGLAGAKQDTMLPNLRKQMMEIGSEFRTRLETLLGDLLMHPDQDLKFLAVAMNYNDMYKPVKRRRRKERERDKGTADRVQERTESRNQ